MRLATRIEPFSPRRIPLCTPHRGSSNSELVNAARHHAPAAWDTLLKRHQLPLYTYAAELLRDDAPFASWLFGIAHQKCVQHWRRNRRAAEVFAPSANDEPTADWPDTDTADPRTTLLRHERAEEFFALLEKLPPVQRSTLLLHVLEDFSLEEIAGITTVPLGTVKSRLHHAKRALRQLVETTP